MLKHDPPLLLELRAAVRTLHHGVCDATLLGPETNTDIKYRYTGLHAELTEEYNLLSTPTESGLTTLTDRKKVEINK